MKGKFLNLLFIIYYLLFIIYYFYGLFFLLKLSMFFVARILYNVENNNDILNINFLDYFNYGFIERLKMHCNAFFYVFCFGSVFYKK